MSTPQQSIERGKKKLLNPIVRSENKVKGRVVNVCSPGGEVLAVPCVRSLGKGGGEGLGRVEGLEARLVEEPGPLLAYGRGPLNDRVLVVLAALELLPALRQKTRDGGDVGGEREGKMGRG